MKKMKSFFTLIILFSITGVMVGQGNEKILEDFQNSFKQKYLKVGVLVQVVGDFQAERTINTNGFNLANFRFKLSGELDKGVGYVVQTSFTKSPAILDAKIYFKVDDMLKFDLGLFKAPFSAEYLISAADIDFVNRSQTVSSLAANRQIGVMASGGFKSANINYSLGIFNGNKFSQNENDNNDFMYVGRIAYNPFLSYKKTNSERLEIGINVAQSKDDNVSIPSINSSFSGERLLFGGDTRINLNDWFLSSEVIFGQFKHSDNVETEPFGYHATVGYMILENLQTVVRWDSYKIDKNLDASEQFVLGFNFWPTSISEFQLNYIVPTKSMLKHNQILINAQVSL